MANFDLKRLELLVNARSNAILARAPQIVADFAHHGEMAMEAIIASAVPSTKTGDARAALDQPNGEHRSPGRIDTGLMINSVNSRSTTDGQVSEGEFGWTGEQEKYFLYQEDGTQYIEAMNALSGAFVIARERAIQDLTEAIRDDQL